MANISQEIADYEAAHGHDVQQQTSGAPEPKKPDVTGPFAGIADAIGRAASAAGSAVAAYFPKPPTPTPAPGTTPGSVSPGPNTGTNAQTTPGESSTTIASSAASIISAWAQGVGLGALSGWISTQATSLAAMGMPASDIASEIEATINQAPGFDQIMPGYNQRMKNGYSNGGGIAAYVQYKDQLAEYAKAAGLPAGFMDGTEVGNLWAGDVSASEVSTRVTQGYADAMTAPSEVRNYLQNYYNVTPGGLAAYYLDPNKSLTLLQQQYNAASVGAAADTTGFDKSLSQAQASSLAAFLATSNNAGMSGGSVNEAQAANAFTTGLGNGLTSAAQMAEAGFTHALPGEAAGSPGQVTQQQLIGGIEGDANAIAALRLATGTRTAATSGGGGFAAGQGGVTGVGYGQQ